jgi:hypothetical protein
MRTSVSDGAETPAAGIDMLGSDMLQSYLGTSGSTSPVASDVRSPGASATEHGDENETLMSASSPGASTDSATSVPEESSDATPLLESTCSVELGPDGENYGQPALPEGITAPRYVSLHTTRPCGDDWLVRSQARNVQMSRVLHVEDRSAQRAATQLQPQPDGPPGTRHSPSEWL